MVAVSGIAEEPEEGAAGIAVTDAPGVSRQLEKDAKSQFATPRRKLLWNFCFG